MKENAQGEHGGSAGRIYYSVYRYVTAAVKSIQLIALSRKFWPLSFWLKFWTYRGEELRVPVKSFEFYVRCRRLHVKLTDLYMITSCVISEQYNSEKGFQIEAQDVVVDIGAHIGSFSIYAAQKAVRGRVLSFEPDPLSYRQLVRNIEINKLKNISAFPAAVAQESGSRTLYRAKLNSAENNIYWGNASGRTVPCWSLADIFAKNDISRCDFLKIDCEGAEYEILTNTPGDVLRKIRRIGIEAHVGRYFGLMEPWAVPETLVEFLRREGFSLEVRKENAIHTFIWAHRP